MRRMYCSPCASDEGQDRKPTDKTEHHDTPIAEAAGVGTNIRALPDPCPDPRADRRAAGRVGVQCHYHRPVGGRSAHRHDPVPYRRGQNRAPLGLRGPDRAYLCQSASTTDPPSALRADPPRSGRLGLQVPRLGPPAVTSTGSQFDADSASGRTIRGSRPTGRLHYSSLRSPAKDPSPGPSTNTYTTRATSPSTSHCRERGKVMASTGAGARGTGQTLTRIAHNTKWR